MGQPVSVDGGRVHDVGVVSPVAAVGDHHVAFGDTWSDRRFTAAGGGEQAEKEPDRGRADRGGNRGSVDPQRGVSDRSPLRRANKSWLEPYQDKSWYLAIRHGGISGFSST